MQGIKIETRDMSW